MGRSRPSRYSGEHAQLQAVGRARALEAQNAEVRRDELRRRLTKALAVGGDAAYQLWQAERPRLVQLGLLAPDVVITPSAWTPRPAPTPHPDPLPPTPTAVEAARVAAELLAERPRMTSEDHLALLVYIARLGLLHRELGWEDGASG